MARVSDSAGGPPAGDGGAIQPLTVVCDQPRGLFLSTDPISLRIPDAAEGAAVIVTFADGAGRAPANGLASASATVRAGAVTVGPLAPGWYRVTCRTKEGRQGSVNIAVAAPRTLAGFRDDSPFGLATPPDDQSEWLLCADMGAAWLQWSMPWAYLETKPGLYWFMPGAPAYLDPDLNVRTANSLGIRTVIQLRTSPKWANAGTIGSYTGTEPHTVCYPPDDDHWADYEKFIGVVIDRFRPLGVRHYEIWAEPLGSFFQSWKTDLYPKLETYQKLLQHAHAAIAQHHPDALLLGPGEEPLDILGQLEKGYTASGSGPYAGKSLPGTGRLIDVATGHFYTTDWQSSPKRIWGPEFANPGRNGQSLAGLVASSQKIAGDRPVWDTEAGYASAQSVQAPEQLWVTEDEQANLMVRYYACALSSGVKKVFWYSWKDKETSTYGLVRRDGFVKPGYLAYRNMTDRLEGLGSPTLVEPGPDHWTVRFSGARTVFVMWKLSAGIVTVDLPAGGNAKVYSRDGAPITPQVVNGRPKISLRGDEPVFVEVGSQ